jgi:hypothetical protein
MSTSRAKTWSIGAGIERSISNSMGFIPVSILAGEEGNKDPPPAHPLAADDGTVIDAGRAGVV